MWFVQYMHKQSWPVDQSQPNSHKGSPFAKTTNRARQEVLVQYFQTIGGNSLSSSKLTNQTHFTSYLQQQVHKESQIDIISNCFDNAHIANLLSQPITYSPLSSPFSLYSSKMNSFDQINHFFVKGRKQTTNKPTKTLTNQQYAIIMSNLPPQNNNFEQQDIIVYPKAATRQNTVHTKIDLLLTQLNLQKSRKGDQTLRIQAISIKLNQYIDFVLEQEDRYLGMSLQGKAQQIIANIQQYRGQEIEGCSKLILIQMFFQELKLLQQLRINLLQKQAKRRQHARSQIEGGVSVVEQRAGYSQPNSQRPSVQEQEWIQYLQ